MRIAVISDIHSNLEALDAALGEIDRREVDHIVCLGDVVGYGADAAASLEIVQQRCSVCILGNHDAAVAMGTDLNQLPEDARKAVDHNRQQLTDEHLAWLRARPLMRKDSPCTFVHASPKAPERWRRLTSLNVIRAQFGHFETDICFVGHTHVPSVMADRLGVHRVRRGHRFLINVGSIGQPRDGDPRVSFAVFDTDTYATEIVRAPYDVDRAVRKIKSAGLPDRLADRLKSGR